MATSWRRYGALLIAAPLLLPYATPAPPSPASPLLFTDLNPDGVEVLAGNGSYDVHWNATHGNDTWFWGTIAFSVDGWGAFVTRGVFPLANGSFLWPVPRYNTTAARFSVCGTAPDGHTACRESGSDFTIQVTPPYLDLLSPRDGAQNVPLNAPLVLGFELVDTSTMNFSIEPSAGTWVPFWQLADRILGLGHTNPFAACTRYTVHLTATGTDGTPLGPYAWQFTTACPPQLVDIRLPQDLGSPLVLQFNRPMNRSSALWQVVPNVPLSAVWSGYNELLSLLPATSWPSCTLISVFLDGGTDFDGTPLSPVGPTPNPFTFASPCPHIVSTSPFDGELDVRYDAPIVIVFSEPLDPASPALDVNVTPDPSPLTRQWSNGDTVLTLTHSLPFASCTNYTVEVRFPPLSPGSAPNPWTFTTHCPAPYTSPRILAATPAAGASGAPLRAPILVTFSEAMLVSSVTVRVTPPVADLGQTWAPGDTILQVDHATLVPCTPYTVAVAGLSATPPYGPLGPGPVPNPWSFTTACVDSWVGGLGIVRAPPSAVSLSWSANPFADGYRIYETTDRLARFPWAVLGETNATTFGASGHLDDSRPHFYLVRAIFGGVEGANSTIAAKTPIRIPFDPSRTNVYPFSLPDRSAYAHASDIAAELTSANVDVLEKWDPTNHTFLPYGFFRGAWRGIDFPIRSGDGLLLGAKRAFEWVVVGTDSNYPRVFTVSPPSSTDRQWVSLPHTSAYRTASDIVAEVEGSLGPTAHTRITEIGTWDPMGQRLVRLRWSPAGWIGVDFAIRAGDPIYLRVVSDFSWIPRLVSPEVP